jgi:ERCC4-related helicase
MTHVDNDDEFDDTLDDQLLVSILDAVDKQHAQPTSTLSVAPPVATNVPLKRPLESRPPLVNNNKRPVTLARSFQTTKTNTSIVDYFSREKKHEKLKEDTPTSEDRLPLEPPELDMTGWDCRPCAHVLDREAAQTWIYPTNRPIRDYQFEIIRVALFVNTLACIPTGLGKTFIASVVMYNYYRWFPRGKIVFACPTKPLVTQQMIAFLQTSGTPAQDVVELTGKHRSDMRAQMWKEKRVFFLTPQTMQNDLTTGICPRNDVVCLVIDEAHRALGNASYCEIVRKLDGCQVRILALTATPGSNADAVQAVVDNLRIGRIEMRTEEADEVRRYTHGRQLDVQVVPVGHQVGTIRDQLSACVQPMLDRVRGAPGVELYSNDPTRIAPFQVLKSVNKYRTTMGRNASAGVIGNLMVIHKLLYCMELLLQHGIRSFLNAILPWAQENASGRVIYARKELAKNETFNQCLEYAQAAVADPSAPGHPKIERLVQLVNEHFERHEQEQNALGVLGQERRETRVMIFSEFRESVSEIVGVLEAYQPRIRAAQFIGQGSGSTRNTRKKTATKDQAKTGARSRRGYNDEDMDLQEDIKPTSRKGLAQKEQQEAGIGCIMTCTSLIHSVYLGVEFV